MHLRVTHQTTYLYSQTVQSAQHMAWLRPVDTLHQKVLSHSLVITPEPASLSTSQDVYGNQRSYFSVAAAHQQLQVTACTEIETVTPAIGYSYAPWEQVRERFAYRAGQPFDVAAEFIYPSPYVPRHSDFSEYAEPSFTPGRGLFEACIDLTERIHTECRYAPASTDLQTPARTALAQRQGVCQDFAHIMIGCLRSLGLPARYVSGYLLTTPPPGQPRLIGADASHAWVSVYLPDAEVDLQLSSTPLNDAQALPFRPASGITRGYWCDFDPTNNRFGWGTPGADYIVVATGRDFGDVTPLRGVLTGGASHSLQVGVTVEPVDNPAQPAPAAPAVPAP
ncbi:MAG: transglutaminase N-terminal domain-containing protein [Brachymonas sp.]|uniref:transglutaminase family protein n=1 Tax=unclassified Brachymonas TaxID=2621329 RepID=UPI0035B10018